MMLFYACSASRIYSADQLAALLQLPDGIAETMKCDVSADNGKNTYINARVARNLDVISGMNTLTRSEYEGRALEQTFIDIAQKEGRAIADIPIYMRISDYSINAATFTSIYVYVLDFAPTESDAEGFLIIYTILPERVEVKQ
jgi:hypothetical protein